MQPPAEVMLVVHEIAQWWVSYALGGDRRQAHLDVRGLTEWLERRLAHHRSRPGFADN